MSIIELIGILRGIQAEHGNIDVVTDEYNGGDDVLRDAKCTVRPDDGRASKPVLVIGGGQQY
jgi:hypothetical protein